MAFTPEVICSIVNAGFSEAVMDFLVGGAGGLVSSTPRLFDISMDAYNDKRLKNGWDRKANNQKETW